MGMPNLSTNQIAMLSESVVRYITEQRNRYIFTAAPLSPGQKAAMGRFFTPQLLNETRLVTLTMERVANPDFYAIMQAAGFNNLPNMSTMGAITFSDCVVSHEPFTNGLLFHELVHVEQYRQLGIPRFSELYFRGFINGGGYLQIPIEQQAYGLGAQYERNPGQHFSVAEEVARWIAGNLF